MMAAHKMTARFFCEVIILIACSILLHHKHLGCTRVRRKSEEKSSVCGEDSVRVTVG